MTISVIIPTYRRPQILLKALQSLQAQSLEDFEIIVVDNHADQQLKAEITSTNPNRRIPVRYVSEPLLGLHYARHSGVKAAQHELLVFTDDDATFDPDWLLAYHLHFKQYPVMVAAGGPVRPIWEEPPPPWLINFLTGEGKRFRSLFSLMEPYQEFRLSPDLYFFGVNMAIRRSHLWEVGGFNPESFGDIWLGNGETGLQYKLQERRLGIGFIPNALVYHHIPPQRMTVSYLCQRMANEGACDIYSRYHCGIPSVWKLFKEALSIVLRYGHLWLAAWQVKGQTAPDSLLQQLQASRLQSQVRYLGRLMSDRTFQALVLKPDWLNPDEKTP